MYFELELLDRCPPGGDGRVGDGHPHQKPQRSLFECWRTAREGQREREREREGGRERERIAFAELSPCAKGPDTVS